jgi:hypothetical protein
VKETGNIKKFFAKVFLGMFMPVFLLSPFNASAEDVATRDVIFALENDQVNLLDYGLGSAVALFGGNGLPLTYKANVTDRQFMAMQNDANFLYAEIDRDVQAATIYPNDDYFNKDDREQWYLDKIEMPDAWEFGTGSFGVSVAIIDTGIHASHVELNDGRVQAGYNVITDRDIPADTDSDDNGHGTAVSGIIGAITDNQSGMAGINWDISLVPVKALSADGSGKISSIAAGIVWAADNRADIINLSLGGNGFGRDQTLNNSIIYAYTKGALIVSAAGNDLVENGQNLDNQPVYPICADGGYNMVIGVAATDESDRKASFSNYGVNCIDISAPGKRILTTAYLPSDPSNRLLIYGSGTSLATPIVSGVAALLKANNPSLTNDRIKEIILNTTDNIDEVNQASCLGSSCNGFLGTGRINALSALSPQPLLSGTLVRRKSNASLYFIDGGKKRLVTDFVFQQRGFQPTQVFFEIDEQLSNYETAEPLAPFEGTLLKSEDDPTVFVIHNNLRHAVTGLVFKSRNFSFSNVITVDDDDLRRIDEGDWFWPPDGTLVVAQNNPTVYVMESGVKRPVTHYVFTQRKLSFSRVVRVTQDEFRHIPNAPDIYWLRPLDGTLIKAKDNPTIYLMQDGTRKPISATAFQARKLRYLDVKVLPQAELDVIQVGTSI